MYRQEKASPKKRGPERKSESSVPNVWGGTTKKSRSGD